MKELNEALLMRTSKAKDGDILVLKDEGTIDHHLLGQFRDAICQATGKNLIVLVLPVESDITLIEADEARSILERIAAQKGS